MYKGMQENTREYKGVHWHARKYKGIQGHTRKYKKIQGNTRGNTSVNPWDSKEIQEGYKGIQLEYNDR